MKMLLPRMLLLAALGAAMSAAADPVISPATLPVLRPTNGYQPARVAPGDFNGDQISDIVLYNAMTSQMQVWTMAGSNDFEELVKSGSRTFNLTAGYYVGAIGDFNGDGLADVVFTSQNQDLYLWTNNDRGGFVSTFIGNYSGGWQLEGSGDIDGDGQDDLVWFNPGACQVGYWLMKEGKRVGSRTFAVTCGYYPVSIGYYTPSARVSILWTSNNHDIYAWDAQDGGSFTSSYLGQYEDGRAIFSIGGGFAGSQVTLVTHYSDSSQDNVVQTDYLTRTFVAGGAPSGYSWDTSHETSDVDGIATPGASPGGYGVVQRWGLFYYPYVQLPGAGFDCDWHLGAANCLETMPPGWRSVDGSVGNVMQVVP
jgi:hypothetical protein